jgi:hypothetical protein
MLTTCSEQLQPPWLGNILYSLRPFLRKTSRNAGGCKTQLIQTRRVLLAAGQWVRMGECHTVVGGAWKSPDSGHGSRAPGSSRLRCCHHFQLSARYPWKWRSWLTSLIIASSALFSSPQAGLTQKPVRPPPYAKSHRKAGKETSFGVMF